MKFAEVIGHKELKERLARGVDSGRVSHAQMFTGMSGYGTLSLALAYAQYVNCLDRQGGDSCGVCPSCVKMAQLAHPDLHFVFPTNSSSKSGSHKPTSDHFLAQWREINNSESGYFDEQKWYEAINIENQQGIISRNDADEVIRKLSFKSFEGRYKTVIIWLPERMGPEAANSLLKILEEPWERTLFILVSQSPSMLLPTIISRVQETAVPRVAEQDVEDYLTSVCGADPGKAAGIAKLCGGDIIAARGMAEGGYESLSGEYFEYFKQLMRLSYNDKHMELIEWADNVASMGREEQKMLLVYCARMLRESYMLSAGMEEVSYLWGEEKDFCSRFAPFIGNHNIEPLIAEITLASRQIAQNGNPRIIFTHFALAVSKMIVRS